jgi:hypothetical protein
VIAGTLLRRLGRRGRRYRQRQGRSGDEWWAHAANKWQSACHRLRLCEFAEMASRTAAGCTAICAMG